MNWTSYKKISFFILAIALLFLGLPQEGLAGKKASKPAERAVMHNNLGVTALYQGDNERALFEFKTATELSPKYVEAWNNLGLAYKYKGDMEHAIHALKKAIELDKKYASPYNHLGSVYYNLGRYNDALEQFKIAIKHNKKFSDAFFNMGLTYEAMAQQGGGNKDYLKMAEDSLQDATRHNPEHPYAHIELARIYQMEGKFEKAIIRYKLGLEINPNLTEGWNNLASLYNQTGETVKAQQALNRAMETEPESLDAGMNRGLSFLQDKNYRLALKEFEAVLAKEPTNEMAYFNIGFTHYNLAIEAKNAGDSKRAGEEFNQAVGAYRSALKLRPTFADAAYNIGFVYQTKNDVPSAITAYRQALTLTPQHGRTLYALGDLYHRQGDVTNAAKYFCVLLALKNVDFKYDADRIKSQIKQWGGCPK